MPTLWASPIAARSAAIFSARVRLRHHPRDEIHRIIFQDARRLTRAAILDNDPRLGIPRLTIDAGELEGFRVRPGDVPVFAGDEHRAVVDGLVEYPARRRIRRSKDVRVAIAARPARAAQVSPRRSDGARFRCRRSLQQGKDSGVRGQERQP